MSEFGGPGSGPNEGVPHPHSGGGHGRIAPVAEGKKVVKKGPASELRMDAFPKATQKAMGAQWTKTLGRSGVSIERNLRDVWEATLKDDAAMKAGMEWYPKAAEECSKIAEDEHVTVATASAVMAALSPGGKWEENINQAHELIGFMKDHPEVKDPEDLAKLARDENKWSVAYGMTNYEKAAAIALGAKPDEILAGAKVRSFYNNLTNPEKNTGDITIDTHMLNIAYGGTTPGVGALIVEVDKPEGAPEGWKPETPRGADYDAFKGAMSSLTGSPTSEGRKIGVLPMLADPIRRIAEESGLLPQQVQAAMWVHWKSEHPPKEKSKAANEAQALTDRKWGTKK